MSSVGHKHGLEGKRMVKSSSGAVKKAPAKRSKAGSRAAPKKARGKSAPTLVPGVPEIDRRLRLLEEQMRAVRAIGAAHAHCLGLDDLFIQIVPNISRLMHAERTTLFLLDAARGEIWAKVAEGEDVRELRLPLGCGIAGWVAEHRRAVNIGDAYADKRFHAEIDARTGFRTRSVAAVPLIDRQGQLCGVLQALNRKDGPFSEDDLGLLEAIATQTAYAVENAQLAERLLGTERLAAVGHMLAGVAHDLRNPMTIISGYAQLMADDQNAERRRTASFRVLHEVDEMTGMIADLLAFARGDSQLHPSLVSLGDLTQEVLGTLKAQCEPRGIRLEVEGADATVMIDLGRAKRVVYNLAKNAIDVLPAGGRLSVKLGAEGGDCLIEVCDDGPGIPEELALRLFSPFATAGKAGGTGLGLSIVKRFVDDHKGRIKVDTTPGAGTTFLVRLASAARPEGQTSPRGQS